MLYPELEGHLGQTTPPGGPGGLSIIQLEEGKAQCVPRSPARSSSLGARWTEFPVLRAMGAMAGAEWSPGTAPWDQRKTWVT